MSQQIKSSASNRLSIQSRIGTYPIYFFESFADVGSMLCAYVRNKHVIIMSDERVASLYFSPLKAMLASFTVDKFVLTGGETTKNLVTFERALLHLQACHAGRDSTVIALGGGVVGDLAGFVAACYQRGIDFIQCPTTLLAQVDSSVGGKVAVNLANVKNGIGAFYQPRAVLIAVDCLTSLTERDFRSGLAEVAKYALLSGEVFFSWLRRHYQAILQRDSRTLLQLVRYCCEIKAKIVEVDEYEQGERVLLNLGHTFAHALESSTNYTVYTHGEAVAIGLYCCCYLSKILGYLSTSQLSEIELLLNELSLSYQLTVEVDTNVLMDLFKRDKKVINGQCRFILLNGIGQAFICQTVTEQAIEATINALPRATS